MFPARCSTLAPVWGAFLACCLLPAIPASSQSAAQWDFDDSLNPSIGAGTLNLGFAAPAAASLFYFTNSSIQGISAKVGYIGRGTFLRASHQLGKNGGGAAVNQYTLIMDVMFPERPSNFTALLQTGTANSTDGDWFIRKSPNGIGVSGIYGGSVPEGEWTRLALVVDNVGKRYVCYVNGEKAMETATGLTLDGRFALFAATLFFADNDQENGPVLINSLQLRNEMLSAEEIASLGSPEARGLPLPVPGNISITSPAQGSVLEAGLSTVIRWTTTNPVGSLRVDWMDGKSRKAVLGTVPASVRQLAWTLDATAGDGTNYTIRLTSLTDTNLQFFSGVFSVTDSIPLNPLYGQSLQKNGGFEEGLTNWTIQAGTPQVLTRTQGKGTPRSGDRFLHGGIRSRSPEAVTRQIVDLTALGFVPRELSQGSVM
ncbi:MAG: hypothetical protein FJ405_14325, partial [Verrucomicrobia bacterium]|nr:hypothetical protein [Verrucomicrobiota bacterium]